MVDRPPLPAEQPWDRSEAYAYTATLPRRAWAWEFLRRDPDFQHAWAAGQPMVSTEAPRARLAALTAIRTLDSLEPWGVIFCRFTRARLQDGKDLLAPRILPARPAAHRRSRRPIRLLLPCRDPSCRGLAHHAGWTTARPRARGPAQSSVRGRRCEHARARQAAHQRTGRCPHSAPAARGARSAECRRPGGTSTGRSLPRRSQVAPAAPRAASA